MRDVERKDRGLPAERRGHPCVIFAIQRRGDHDVAVDREGHHEAVAVVDMLADEIHAAGCGGGNGGFDTEVVLETGGGIGGEIGERDGEIE